MFFHGRFSLGGIAQFYASILDSKHNNTFGTTAFGAYGLFWMAVGLGWLVQAGVFGENLMASVDTRQLGVVYLGYLIFTVFMTIGALETNKVLFFIFVLINFLFIGLIIKRIRHYGARHAFTCCLF